MRQMNPKNSKEEDEVIRALKRQRALGLAETYALIPYQRAHLGAVFLNSVAASRGGQ
ncbi:hypothetical protein J31TS4_21650 [Paenibacillus sp. J31TS4]|nr:hypothetical protein J31TS4_21650 [Paenibacillus sp. J31TS4]